MTPRDLLEEMKKLVFAIENDELKLSQQAEDIVRLEGLARSLREENDALRRHNITLKQSLDILKNRET